MKILVPITVTDEMIQSGSSIAEPAAGETAWATATAYAVGDRRIRTQTHRVYECVAAHTSDAVPPENNPTKWVDVGPTQRWAPFDNYISTAARDVGSITYVLEPGYVNAIALYGLVGTNFSLTIKDAPGGSVIYEYTTALADPPAGWYEYFFTPYKPLTKILVPNLPLRANPEYTITVSAGVTGAVAIGLLVLGDYRSLINDVATFGGAISGAAAEPITYSYIKTNDDGTTQIVRRHSATSMRASLVIPREYADESLRLVQEVLDVPVCWVASEAPGYEGLNVFGLGSGRLSYDSQGIATMEITVKGMI